MLHLPVLVSSAVDRYGTIFEDDSFRVIVKCRSVLETYQVPRSVVRIRDGDANENAFGEHCSLLQNVTFEDGCLIEAIGRYSFYKSPIRSIDLRPCAFLKTISPFAFCDCTKLSSVVFSDSIEAIGSNSFKSVNVSSVKLPANLKMVEYVSFGYCPKLTECQFDPECKTTDILSEAFVGSGLSSIRIPKSVTKLENAFIYCPLSRIEIDPLNKEFHVVNNVVYSIDNSTLVLAPRFLGSYELPSATRAIGPNALRSCYISDLVLNNGLETIDRFAIAQSNISHITIPYSVSKISYCCFYNSGLKTVDFNCSIRSIESSLFSMCTKLARIEIPPTVTTVQIFAFQECRALTYMKIPASVQTIASGAFSGINKSCFFDVEEGAGLKIINGAQYSKDGKTLSNYFGENGVDFTVIDGTERIGSSSLASGVFASLSFPASVRTIEDSALSKTQIRSPLDLSCVATLGSSALKESNVSSVSLGEGLLSIPEGCFSGCANLKRIKIPNTVQSVGDLAFDGCASLSLVEFGVGLGEPSLSAIGDQAFRETALRSIEFPKAVLSLGYKVLGGSKVTTVAFHSDNPMKNLSNYALAGCAELTAFSFPRRLEVVGEYCFEGDVALPSVGLSDKIRTIKGHAFSGCRSLRTVRIGDFSELETIEGMAFEGCTALAEFEISDENHNFDYDSSVLFNGDRTRIIVYLTASERTSFVVPQSVAAIGPFAFYGAANLESVRILEGCRSIGVEAFRECRALSRLELPLSVTEVGASVFADCPMMQCGSLIFPEGFNLSILLESALPDEAYSKCATVLFSINHFGHSFQIVPSFALSCFDGPDPENVG